MRSALTVGGLCGKLGMSRQNYYKARRERQRMEADSGLIEQLVRAERAVQPRLGGRKLYHILRPELAYAGVKIGRDRFFEVLREKGLLLDRLPGMPKTTNSRHSLPVFHNLVKDIELVSSNQAWAADITYIRADEGFLYLSLLMDMWSRKIVGYNSGDTLEAEGAVRALEMALSELPKGAFPVHHSDRGCQYCSHLYVEKLHAHGLAVSMTEEMHCYENACAERLNGILKQEYSLGCSFRNKKQALAAVDEAVLLYNTKRPHLSLNYETPEKMHRKVA
ncbi:MAG: IS3 family transposase [Spirochaetaceae bacterium]|nr:IS3 family transposase [Spirochaetaceae bacterium]